jgi:acetyl esterase/lipase
MRRTALAVSMILMMAACSPMSPRRLATTPNGFQVQTQEPVSELSDEAVNPGRGSDDARSLAVTSWEHFHTFDVGIVEFDEHGNVFSPAQYDVVVGNIRRQAMTTGATVVVFVHGWHHSARWNDTNLVSFRRVLRALAKQPVGMGCKFDAPIHAPVIGVYVGWRGESVPVPVANLFTIWSRKRVAQHIGGAATDWESKHTQYSSTEFEKLLRDLDKIHDEANATAAEAGRSFTSLVVAGHSLGGAMILSAMQRIVFHATIDQAKVVDPKKLNRIGDAVVLLNPAVEARRYKAFRAEAAQTPFPDDARPILITISSSGDSPNRIAFRVARSLQTLVIVPRWREWRDSTTALGFSKPDITHSIKAPAELLNKTLDEIGEIDFWPGDLRPDPDMAKTIDLARSRKYNTLDFSNDQNVDNFVPFFVTNANQAVIPDHSRIFTPGVVSFLVPFATASERKGILSSCTQALHAQKAAP